MRDDEIISLYFERDEKALAETEEKYGAYCRAVAENILRNSEDVEECINSAWLGAWNAIPPNTPKNLKIFLAKITRNIALNKLKAKTAEKRGGDESCAILDELSECISSGESIEEGFVAKELGESINRFAARLPKRERNIFIRRYFFMETAETIGERYALSANNVAVILHRIRKKLKNHLEKEGYTP
ncbi:MAG: sigma-70 family RNA polymerase sigma factor [Oscillospiraceae bacterium]|nr:sigma-70 family RNA polymerase sigma factor [Oscillospiraceae bacterium]